MTEQKRESPRFRESTWHGKPNFECTRCAFATLDRGKMLRHVRADHPTQREGGSDPLAGVNFASDEAAELAADLGVTAAVLRTKTPSGKNGFTVADVRAAAPNSEEV